VGDSAVDPAGALLRVLDLLVDMERGTVMRGKQRIDLPDLSFRLFATLIRHAPNEVSKDDLIREVWGNVVVGDEALAQRVRLLRQALGEDSQSPRYFQSVRGRGYRLICDTTLVEETSTHKRSKYGLVAVALVAVAAVIFFSMPRDEPVALPPSTALAVLPFSDLSASQSYGYFADGMHEELLTRLTSIDGLQVSSRTSVEPYRATRPGIAEIAEQLHVGAIIEGSVRVDDDRIRVTVQLIEAQTDQHLWADNFDRSLSVQNIFSIQEEVARQIALALQREYADISEPQPVQLPTGNLDAYTAYLLGRHHTFRQTTEDLELAVAYLEQATALDPNFAEAFAVLGWSYSFLGTNYGNLLPKVAYPRAKNAALRAITLDSNLSDARSLYADILTWYDWDFEAAEKEYLKTIELDPINVLGYALFLSVQERHDEAIELIERRLQAHPDDPYVHINAAWRFMSAQRYDRAIKEAELAGDHSDAPAALGYSWLAKGDSVRAISYFESDLENRGRQPRQLSNLASAYYTAGRREQGQALLLELEAIAAERFVSPALLASVYFSAGDDDMGFASLQAAVDARVRDVIFLRDWRRLDQWRDDPRYLELVRTIGFDSAD
jgi:TolB-like protein/DNA-binding winged helix-turn-helix (wHTH) protein/Flp pilus assembly protein TadD